MLRGGSNIVRAKSRTCLEWQSPYLRLPAGFANAHFGSTESDVLYFETFGSKWVVLNSLKAAVELLEKRGSRYADRPRFVMFEECVSVTPT